VVQVHRFELVAELQVDGEVRVAGVALAPGDALFDDRLVTGHVEEFELDREVVGERLGTLPEVAGPEGRVEHRRPAVLDRLAGLLQHRAVDVTGLGRAVGRLVVALLPDDVRPEEPTVDPLGDALRDGRLPHAREAADHDQRRVGPARPVTRHSESQRRGVISICGSPSAAQMLWLVVDGAGSRTPGRPAPQPMMPAQTRFRRRYRLLARVWRVAGVFFMI
jgi:hypothetical protein